KDGYFSRELFDDLRRKRAPRGEGFEQRAIVEAAHFDNGVDEFSRAIERETAVRLAGDAPRAKIERGRGAPVERDFEFAHCNLNPRVWQSTTREICGETISPPPSSEARKRSVSSCASAVMGPFLSRSRRRRKKIRVPGINPLSAESPDVTGAPPAMGDYNET